VDVEAVVVVAVEEDAAADRLPTSIAVAEEADAAEVEDAVEVVDVENKQAWFAGNLP